MDDLPAHVAETEPRGEVVYRREVTRPGGASIPPDDTSGTSGQRDEGPAEEQPSSPLRARSRSQHGSRVRSVAGRR
eukprot:2147124-Karenia_brevis.AAC.1